MRIAKIILVFVVIVFYSFANAEEVKNTINVYDREGVLTSVNYDEVILTEGFNLTIDVRDEVNRGSKKRVQLIPSTEVGCAEAEIRIEVDEIFDSTVLIVASPATIEHMEKAEELYSGLAYFIKDGKAFKKFIFGLVDISFQTKKRCLDLLGEVKKNNLF